MRYRLSQVQSTLDVRVAFAGVGFNIANEHGAPIVTFGYFDPTDAENCPARAHLALPTPYILPISYAWPR